MFGKRAILAAKLTLAAASFTGIGLAEAAGDRALGEYLSGECVTCHQLSGKQQPGIPSIVGKPAASIVESLSAYRSKQRPNEVMQTVAGRLSNDEIAALAAYFSSLKPRK